MTVDITMTSSEKSTQINPIEEVKFILKHYNPTAHWISKHARDVYRLHYNPTAHWISKHARDVIDYIIILLLIGIIM